MLLKIEPSEITPFFYNIFSASGGFSHPLPPKSAYVRDNVPKEKNAQWKFCQKEITHLMDYVPTEAVD